MWFVVAGVIALAGLVAAALYARPRLGALDEGTTRIVAPGTATLVLDKPGHYTIFHERRSLVDGRYYASDSVDGLRVTLVAEGSGAPIELGQPKMSSSYEIGSREGRSFLDFDIAQPGNHEVSHHAVQRNKEIAADTMGGYQSRAGFSVSHPGGRL